jgi:N-acetylmuramic acid 6-phosphate etherase
VSQPPPLRLTERRNPRTAAIDTASPLEIVDLIAAEDATVPAAVHREREAIARATSLVETSFRAGGRLLYVGAGTSGRLGVLEAAECPPTFGTDPRRIRAVLAGGPESVFSAAEGAEDREDEGRAAVAELRDGDLLIAVSASSVTPFVRGALAAARTRGVRTVLLTCAQRAAAEADLILALDTGAEVLTGSTRLKAGSATKAALNAITTVAMVRLGKVFAHYMVDLRTGSAKLRDRARRIVAAAGEVAPERAEELLREAGGEVKTAIVAARLGVDATTARARLDGAAGRVRAALET